MFLDAIKDALIFTVFIGGSVLIGGIIQEGVFYAHDQRKVRTRRKGGARRGHRH